MYSLNATEAEAACHSLDSRQANQQDIQYAQAQGSDCCECGWSTSGATYPTDNSRHGCLAYDKCSWSNIWNTWCVADTGKSAFTMITSSNGNISRVTGPLCGNSPVIGEFPHKGQWHGALVFSLIWAWTISWANNGDAGELWGHRAHYDVIVMP